MRRLTHFWGVHSCCGLLGQNDPGGEGGGNHTYVRINRGRGASGQKPAGSSVLPADRVSSARLSSRGVNGGVFCADCLESLFVSLAVKAPDWIRAKNVYIVGFP